jgi:hypothetical protein
MQVGWKGLRKFKLKIKKVKFKSTEDSDNCADKKSGGKHLLIPFNRKVREVLRKARKELFEIFKS